MLNVCGDMIHRTCAKGTDKRGTLYCSCGKDDDSDPLLPPPDYDDANLFEEICDKCSEVISKVPLSRVGVTLQMPVVLLPCKHRVHFFCIDSKRKLCPKCPSIYELEKEGYYISPTIQETPRKRRGKRAHINPLEAQKHKPSFVSCLSSQLADHQLVHFPKVLT